MIFFKKKSTANHVKAKKQLVCLNTQCLSTFAKADDKCLSCGSPMHKFDSKGEAERFQYLVYVKKVKIQALQKKFILVDPMLELKYTGRFTDDFIVVGLGQFKKASKKRIYTADFVYGHPDYPGRITIEDYKPCGIIKDAKGKPKLQIQYQGDSYLRIRQIASQYQSHYNMLVSYHDGKVYHEKIIEP